jgi:hypothetical protein
VHRRRGAWKQQANEASKPAKPHPAGLLGPSGAGRRCGTREPNETRAARLRAALPRAAAKQTARNTWVAEGLRRVGVLRREGSRDLAAHETRDLQPPPPDPPQAGCGGGPGWGADDASGTTSHDGLNRPPPPSLPPPGGGTGFGVAPRASGSLGMTAAVGVPPPPRQGGRGWWRPRAAVPRGRRQRRGCFRSCRR